MIAAIYARKSPVAIAVGEDAKSVTRQVEHASAYAARKGWTVDESWIVDDDEVSGAEFDARPGLRRLLAALKPRPPFQVLVMSEESRLGRETIETAFLLKQFVQAGVRVLFYLTDTEGTLNTPIEKAMLTLQTMSDEMERDRARQRVQDSMRQRARAGYVTGGIVFGYDNVPVLGEGGKKSHVIRAINEAQAAVVRRIFALSANGTGYSRIAQQLNREGAPAPKPKRGRPRGWSHSTVRVVLHRRMYVGEGVYNQTEKRNVWGQKKLRRRPQQEWIPVVAPPIISEAEWRAAHDRQNGVRQRPQNLGAAMGNRRARDVESPYLLSSFARCEVCGSSLSVLSGGRARRSAYGCSRAYKTSLCPNRLRAPMERADDAVLHAIVDQVLTETVVDAIVGRVLTKLAPTVVSRTVTELQSACRSSSARSRT